MTAKAAAIGGASAGEGGHTPIDGRLYRRPDTAPAPASAGRRAGGAAPSRRRRPVRQWQPVQERSGGGVQTGRDAQDVLEPEAALAALDLAELGPVDMTAHGSRLLAESQFVPAGPYPGAKVPGSGVEGRLGWAGHNEQPHTPRT